MNLDRNNYEDFFLLYVDGELNASQKQLVEEFVQANPDLQHELDMLNEAVLQIEDELVFGNKASLFKTLEEGAISTANYQENFLLYVDNELNDTSKAKVETFVLQHPTLQDEFTLLKQTKLQPELIACPDKESLYKKEERPVVFMWARRLAVAAAILFFAVMAWMLIPKKSTTGIEGLANNKGEIKKVAPTVTPAPINPLNKNTKGTENINQQTPLSVQQLTASTAIGSNKKGVETKNTIIKKSTPKQITNNVAPQQQNIAFNQPPVQKQDPVIAVVAPQEKEQNTVAVKNIAPTVNNTIAATNRNPASAAIVQPAVYRELNTDDESDNKIVYIGSMEIKKDKINNLFKKAKQLFGKKQSNDDASQSTASNSRTLR